jgi:hypothetical protein
MQISTVKWLKGPLLLLSSIDEIWLGRFILKGNRFSLIIYSRFSHPNELFVQFQNKLPRSDLDNPAFMTEFKQRHTIRQLSTLDTSSPFTRGCNYLVVLYSKFLLVLQLDRLVFKIHQLIELE